MFLIELIVCNSTFFLLEVQKIVQRCWVKGDWDKQTSNVSDFSNIVQWPHSFIPIKLWRIWFFKTLGIQQSEIIVKVEWLCWYFSVRYFEQEGARKDNHKTWLLKSSLTQLQCVTSDIIFEVLKQKELQGRDSFKKQGQCSLCHSVFLSTECE